MYNNNGDNNNGYNNSYNNGDNNYFQTQENVSYENKKSNKKIIGISILIVAIVCAAVFALAQTNLIKSDTEVVLSAFSNSMDKYLCSENQSTFYNKLIDSKTMEFIEGENNKYKTDFKVVLNDVDGMPESFKNSGIEVISNTDNANKESSFSINAIAKGMNLSVADAYSNEEYFIGMISAISDKKVYFNIDDLEKQIFNDNVLEKEFFDSLKQDIDESSLKNIIEILKSHFVFEKNGTLDVNGYNSDLYTVKLDKNELKTLLQEIVAEIEKDKASSFDDIDINSLEIKAAVYNDELTSFEIIVDPEKDADYSLSMKFTGESNLTDNALFEISVGNNGSYNAGISFLDKTERNNKEVSNSKEFSIKGINESKLFSSILKTDYNTETNNFNGSLNFDGEKSNSVFVDFNGSFNEDSEFTDVNFEHITTKQDDKTLADVSVEFKVNQSQGVITINKDDDSIDAINQNDEFIAYINQIGMSFGNLFN